MWKKVMSQIHAGLEYRSFNVPDDTYLTPIPGVIPITIWIRGVDESGAVLYEEQTYGGKSTVEGREIEVTAKKVEEARAVAVCHEGSDGGLFDWNDIFG